MKVAMTKSRFYIIQVSIFCMAIVSLSYLFYPVVKGAFVHEKPVIVAEVPRRVPLAVASAPTSGAPVIPDSSKLPEAPYSRSNSLGPDTKVNIAQSFKVPATIKVDKHISVLDNKVITPNLPEEDSVESPEPSRHEPKITETTFERYLRMMANICSVLFPVAGTTLSLLWRYEVIHPPGSKMKRRRMMRDEDDEMFVV